MQTRRDWLKQAGAAAAVALAPRAAEAQARKTTLTIALPSTPETIDPHQLRSVLSGSILGLMGEGLLTRDPQTMELLLSGRFDLALVGELLLRDLRLLPPCGSSVTVRLHVLGYDLDGYVPCSGRAAREWER